MNPREGNIRKLGQGVFDALIVGSGINGAVAAAAIVTIAPEFLRHPPHAWPAAIAVALTIGSKVDRVRRLAEPNRPCRALPMPRSS